LLRAAVITIVCRACRWARRRCRRAHRQRTASTARAAALRADRLRRVIRGTPLLLQLFVLYFGLAQFIQLPAFVAALLGLGLNYAAYESEIYRGALEAVPSATGCRADARFLGAADPRADSCAAGLPYSPSRR
jgi:His/Glu/Gln/Arg/opine family amino acid ABC transporter permease subunit